MPESSNPLNKIPEQAINVITKPAAFFAAMRKGGGLADPVIFLIVMGVISALVKIIMGFAGLASFGMLAAAGLMAIIMVPIFITIGGFISAFLLYLFWRVMGSEENYETAFRCVAYAAAIAPITAILQAIPYIGSAASTAWGVWLLIIASTAVHGIAQKKARLWFGITGAIFILLGLSTEYAARNAVSQFEGYYQQQLGGDFNNQSPEDVGKAMGAFLKSMEESSK